jgi:hypothetical protein
MRAWWERRRHPADWLTLAQEVGATREDVEHVEWLGQRYMDHYGWEPPADWDVLGTEIEVRVPVPGTDDLELHGFMDAAVKRPDGIWVVEDKSYGKRDRLEYVHVSLQETLMAGAFELQFELPVAGVIFNGVYTQRWKPTYPTQRELMEEGRTRVQAKAHIDMLKQRGLGIDRPLADSFDRIETTRTPEMYEHAWRIVASAAQVRRDLRERRRVPIPNFGPACRWCDNKYACFGDMLGEEDYGDIVVVDDE